MIMNKNNNNIKCKILKIAKIILTYIAITFIYCYCPLLIKHIKDKLANKYKLIKEIEFLKQIDLIKTNVKKANDSIKTNIDDCVKEAQIVLKQLFNKLSKNMKEQSAYLMSIKISDEICRDKLVDDKDLENVNQLNTLKNEYKSIYQKYDDYKKEIDINYKNQIIKEHTNICVIIEDIYNIYKQHNIKFLYKRHYALLDEALTRIQKLYVHNSALLTKLQEKLKIITIEDKEKIKEIQDTYDVLDMIQQHLDKTDDKIYEQILYIQNNTYLIVGTTEKNM